MKKTTLYAVIICVLLPVLYIVWHNNYTGQGSDLRENSVRFTDGSVLSTTSQVMKIESQAFENGASIPSAYTCDGTNSVVPLALSNVPANTVSLVLVMNDPDVPTHLRPDGNFDHWVIFNIPPTTKRIDSNIIPGATLGINGSGKTGYYGPCPPDREHRYFFRLYALDTTLELKEGASRREVLKAIDSHVIAEAELMGRYERGK